MTIMINSKNFIYIVLLFLFYNAMHDTIIYLMWPPIASGTSNLYRYEYGYSLPLNVYSQDEPISQSVRALA